MLRTYYRFHSLRGILTAWMALVFSSTSIEHAHAAGKDSLNNSLGILSLAGDFAPVSNSSKNGEQHRHRLLFGIELPAEPCMESEVDAMTAICLESEDSYESFDFASLIPDELVRLTTPLVAETSACVHKRTGPTLLCTSALRLVAGVLRV
ncbi:hypothetical protein BH11PLA2_BH11PLA2_31560 [soil metagenome]